MSNPDDGLKMLGRMIAEAVLEKRLHQKPEDIQPEKKSLCVAEIRDTTVEPKLRRPHRKANVDALVSDDELAAAYVGRR